MAVYNFIPYVTMDISVKFDCLNCGKEIYEFVSVPSVNMETQNIDVKHNYKNDSIQCSNCKKNYEYSIISSGIFEINDVYNSKINFEEYDLGRPDFRICPYNETLKVNQYGDVLNNSTNRIMNKRIKNGCYIVDDPRGIKQYDNGQRDYEWVHRLVALTWLKESPFYMVGEVDHIDENGLNNRIDNLEWLSRELHNKKTIEYYKNK
jgi:transcription elongation factor Elf1